MEINNNDQKNVKNQDELIESIKKLFDEAKQNKNFFIKEYFYRLIINDFNLLNDENKKIIQQVYENNLKELNNNLNDSKSKIDNNCLNEYIDFMQNKNSQMSNEKFTELLNIMLTFFLPCLWTHEKNLCIIKDLLDECKKNLDKLENKIKNLDVELKNENDLSFWDYKEVTYIAISLRYCIEIVIWWTFKYNDDETVNKINKKLKNKFWAGKLFEIYKNDDDLEINIETINYDKPDFLLTRELLIENYDWWKKENIKKIYSELSSLLHYNVIEHVIEESSSSINKIGLIFDDKDKNLENILLNKKNMLQEKYDLLNFIYEFIYKTLKNHRVLIHNELILYVREFEVDLKLTEFINIK